MYNIYKTEHTLTITTQTKNPLHLVHSTDNYLDALSWCYHNAAQNALDLSTEKSNVQYNYALNDTQVFKTQKELAQALGSTPQEICRALRFGWRVKGQKISKFIVKNV